MRKALIIAGAVAEVVDSGSNPFPQYHPSLTWIECPATVLPGYSWDGSFFRPAIAPPGTPYSITLMTESASQLLTLGGVELTNSRRILDFTNISQVRVQFKGSIQVRVEASMDWGSSWVTLVPESSYDGSNPYISEWIACSDAVRTASEVLLRCLGVGIGLLTTVNYVEMQYR